MASIWQKLNSELSVIYVNYLAVKERGPSAVPVVHPVVAKGGRLHVALQYTGDLDEIQRLGFEPVWRERPGHATGAIDLANLERLAAHPNVRKLSVGREKDLLLDVSVPQIRANLIWSFSNPPPSFGGSTGSGAMVGVIDSGIDFRHTFFLDHAAAVPTTRIWRIWDPGLSATGAETPPDVALLSPGSPASYGVEYTNAHINDVLQGVAGAMPVRHRDCVGHGTHVASIAAGNGGPQFTLIGVAPGAELIIVKILALQTDPIVGGGAVPFSQRLKDAVNYILNVAAARGRPVAINYSVGTDLGPHDGFTDDEDFLTNRFSATSGCVFVSAAGNNGGTRRQHARVEFPAGGGTVDIPFLLEDPRTNRRIFDTCAWVNGTKDLFIQVYYPDGPTDIDVSLDIPGDGTGFIAGPAFGGAPVTGTFGGRQFTMTHGNDNNTLTSGATVNRKQFEITITPFRNRHRTGQYMVRISSPAALTVHVWCHQARRHGFKVDTTPPVAANVFVERQSTVGADGGADNIVTVAAYDPNVATLDVADFSSAGQLASYGPLAQPSKPDIAAPGVGIDAAESRDERPHRPGNATQKQGTSMAAPHVTGAAALLLEKAPAMTTADVIAKLKGFVVTAPPASTDDVGAGRLDAKNSWDNTP